MKKIILVAVFVLIFINQKSEAQFKTYYYPEDTLVSKNLESWKNFKFGLLMHWGTYSQWGIVESWSLCSEDEGWCERRGPYGDNYTEYKKRYEELQFSFNPVKFTPDKWAAAAKYAGMKYVVFTTKHHDGFCMFDTKYTDYKITSDNCMFHKNEKANVTKEIFNSFRNQGFKVGAYFSKPDWHCNDFWWSKFATPNRCSNYDTKKYPEKWKAFEDFTYNQLNELTTQYGKVDLLWLDGGWVRPDSTITDEERSWIKVPYTQEINMNRIASMARKNQPGILIVDRSVYGNYQNYLTPEQQIPDKPLSYPWETCMTMGDSWSYVPNDHYKSTNKLIHLLVDIVSKGGNFLLNIGPDAKGELADTAYLRLKEIGDWMKINSECIYNSSPIAPYKSGKVCFTKSSNVNLYAIYLAEENEALPQSITIQNFIPDKNSKIILLGVNGNVKWKVVNGNTVLTLPKITDTAKLSKHAWVFRIKS